MQIREATINDQKKWNEFIRASQGGSFLQSWEWADFMATQKEKIWKSIIKDMNKNNDFGNATREKWLAVIFLFKSKLKFGGSILYAPRGPVVADEYKSVSSEIMALILEKVNHLARGEQATMFQLDPCSEDKKWHRIFRDLDLAKSGRDIQPRHTLILDIRPAEEEILKQMHQKTRYNIRLAQKKNVEIIVDNESFKEFYELLKKTERRQSVKFFEQDYFKNILRVPFVKLYLARADGKVIAANIMVFWNDTATYLFGASDYEFRETMAPHLLQWQAIQDAKKEGFWFYDFWGAAPLDSEGRASDWAGFTKFKMGFSPDAEIIEYIGTYEKIYQPVKLGLYRFLRNIYRK